MEFAASASNAEELDGKIEGEIRRLQQEVARYSHMRQAGSVSGWRDINVSASLAVRMFEMREQRRAHGDVLRVETELKSKDGHLIGRPDVFRLNGRAASLREYKTGTIRNEMGRIKSDYLDQITLYAALIFDNYDVEAVEASLESLNGDRHAETIHLEEARMFSQHVTERLAAVNKLARTTHTFADLALPSADACNYCSLRPVCTPFKVGQDGLGLKGDQFLAEGTVESLEVRMDDAPRAVTFSDEIRGTKIELLLPGPLADQLCVKQRYQFLNLHRRGVGLEWSDTSQALSYE